MNKKIASQAFQVLAILGFLLYSIVAVALDGFPWLLVGAAFAWPIAFCINKRTVILRDSEDIASATRLTYRQYHEAMHARANSLHGGSYYKRTDKHWTEKMTNLMGEREAMAYVHTDSRVILTLIVITLPIAAPMFFPSAQEALQSISHEVRFPLGLLFGGMLGFVSGSKCGEFYRWFRGNTS